MVQAGNEEESICSSVIETFLSDMIHVLAAGGAGFRWWGKGQSSSHLVLYLGI